MGDIEAAVDSIVDEAINSIEESAARVGISEEEMKDRIVNELKARDL